MNRDKILKHLGYLEDHLEVINRISQTLYLAGLERPSEAIHLNLEASKERLKYIREILEGTHLEEYEHVNKTWGDLLSKAIEKGSNGVES